MFTHNQYRQLASQAAKTYQTCRLTGDHTGARRARAQQLRAALAFNRNRWPWQQPVAYLRMELPA